MDRIILKVARDTDTRDVKLIGLPEFIKLTKRERAEVAEILMHIVTRFYLELSTIAEEVAEDGDR